MTIKTRKYRTWLCVVGVFLLLSSCVDRFIPEIDGFQRALIVDGIFSDEPIQQEVRLLRSSIEINQAADPELGAKVELHDDSGGIYQYEEVSNGVYRTVESGFAQTGRSYTLNIETSTGQKYISTSQLMKDAEPIRRVYAEVEYKYFYAEQSDLPGYQFYVDGPENVTEESYFMWLPSATYKYQADYAIDFSWTGFLTPFPNRDSLRTCYRDISVLHVSTFSTQQLSGNGAAGIPLHFLRADLESMSIRYSLLVKQYAISKEAHRFWNGIEQQLGSDADLYTTQPYEIRGNISNLENTDELVLGFFTVGAVSEERIFVDPPAVELPYEAPCIHDYMAYSYIGVYGPDDYPIYVSRGPSGGLALLGVGCLDCRELGGQLEAPEFWEE